MKGFDNPPQRGLLDDEGAEVVDPLSDWYKSGPKGVNQKKLLAQKDHGLVLIDQGEPKVSCSAGRESQSWRTHPETRQHSERVLSRRCFQDDKPAACWNIISWISGVKIGRGRFVEGWMDRSGPVDRQTMEGELSAARPLAQTTRRRTLGALPCCWPYQPSKNRGPSAGRGRSRRATSWRRSLAALEMLIFPRHFHFRLGSASRPGEKGRRGHHQLTKKEGKVHLEWRNAVLGIAHRVPPPSRKRRSSQQSRKDPVNGQTVQRRSGVERGAQS